MTENEKIIEINDIRQISYEIKTRTILINVNDVVISIPLNFRCAEKILSDMRNPSFEELKAESLVYDNDTSGLKQNLKRN